MKILGKILVVSSLLGLAACDSGTTLNIPETTTPPAPAVTKVQVLHGSPDAPAVNVLVDGSEVLSGVEVGEQVIVKGQRSLKHGMPIKVLGGSSSKSAQPTPKS